jgi:ribonuclease E
MLINAMAEEIWVALVDGQHIYDLDLENTGREQKKGNIYLGTVKNLEPSLNAAFIDFGAERHGFLPVKEIAREYWQTDTDEHRPNIKDILKVGQQILVQVDKEERGSKGAALTTFITLAGCYLVLMPNNPRAGGISRRIEGDERDELKETMDRLTAPDGMGLIVRTAGVGRSSDELEWDLSVLVKRWEDIQKAIATLQAPALIHQERDIIARVVRDHLRDDIGEIIIDNEFYYQKTRQYIERLRPEALSRVKLHTDKVPLFSRFQIESQIESAFHRELTLPSGGSLVIDHTEALISIDINSARATKGGDIEETALSTNLEAADEIARQLRLRDIGGLIVIDFIDMTPSANQRAVENRLREALRVDRARVQIGRISRFGLLEMSRQRLRSSLGETIQEPCPRCSGQGVIRSVSSLAVAIMRLVEEEAMKDNSAQIHVAVPIEVASYLTNEKRLMLTEIEARHGVRVVIMPITELHTPHYEIKRVRVDEAAQLGDTSSYELAKSRAIAKAEEQAESVISKSVERPAIEFLSHEKPPEVSMLKKCLQGLVAGVASLFKSNKRNAKSKGGRQSADHQQRGRRRGGRGGRDRNERGNRGRGGERRRGGRNDYRTGGDRDRNDRRGSGDRNTRRDDGDRERNERRDGGDRDRNERRDGSDRDRNNRRGGRDRNDRRSGGERNDRRGGQNRHRRHQQGDASDTANQNAAPEISHESKTLPMDSQPPVAAPEQMPVVPAASKYNSPLNEEAPLVDVTQMNAANTSSNADTEQKQQRRGNKYPRRRANHLRPYSGAKNNDNAEADKSPADSVKSDD